MTDVIMIAISVGFFALTWGLTVLSDRLMGPEGPAAAHSPVASQASPTPKIIATQPLTAAKAEGR